MPTTSSLFRAALGRFASGVTVVTSVDAAGCPNGLTVSAFSSVSLDPPLVVIAIGRDNDSGPAIRGRGRFNVHLLASDQEPLSRRFSERIVGDDPFTGLTPRQDDHGLPWLPGALALLGCRVTQAVDAGDHILFIGEVESIDVADGEPLLYYRGGYRRIEAGSDP
ncbi:MAG: flavin reductase family protein [Candidatus Eisenbacteria bacterium]|nr:flavin reductase family protein [Candidatus Eisenbacteria bacterium]